MVNPAPFAKTSEDRGSQHTLGGFMEAHENDRAGGSTALISPSYLTS